jgi:hypothetical protein
MRVHYVLNHGAAPESKLADVATSRKGSFPDSSW